VSSRLRFRVLGSGSKGNATLVEGGGTRILLDAGLGPRILAERLQDAGIAPESVDAILLSHEHSDHAAGALRFSARWGVPIRACGSIQKGLKRDGIKAPAFGDLDPSGSFAVGRLTVTTFRVHHDARDPLGFLVEYDGTSLGHATDLGLMTGSVMTALSACDALVLEANYDPLLLRNGPYPWTLKERILSDLGHLSNGDAACFLERGGSPLCRKVVLAHLSENNNHPELALRAASEALHRSGRRGVEVEVAAARGSGWLDVGPVKPRQEPTQSRLF
jgi:phosphoribosyl 1,2-cyclic phosphodiesterase